MRLRIVFSERHFFLPSEEYRILFHVNEEYQSSNIAQLISLILKSFPQAAQQCPNGALLTIDGFVALHSNPIQPILRNDDVITIVPISTPSPSSLASSIALSASSASASFSSVPLPENADSQPITIEESDGEKKARKRKRTSRSKKKNNQSGDMIIADNVEPESLNQPASAAASAAATAPLPPAASATPISLLLATPLLPILPSNAIPIPASIQIAISSNVSDSDSSLVDSVPPFSSIKPPTPALSKSQKKKARKAEKSNHQAQKQTMIAPSFSSSYDANESYEDVYTNRSTIVFPERNYSQYKAVELSSLTINDVIAYRAFEIADGGSPQLSDYREAKVLEIDASSQVVKLQHLFPPISRSKYYAILGMEQDPQEESGVTPSQNVPKWQQFQLTYHLDQLNHVKLVQERTGIHNSQPHGQQPQTSAASASSSSSLPSAGAHQNKKKSPLSHPIKGRMPTLAGVIWDSSPNAGKQNKENERMSDLMVAAEAACQ